MQSGAGRRAVAGGAGRALIDEHLKIGNEEIGMVTKKIKLCFAIVASVLLLAGCSGATSFHAPMAVNTSPLQAIYFDHTMRVGSYERHVVVTAGGMMHVTDKNAKGRPGVTTASLQLSRTEIQSLVDVFAGFDSFASTYPGGTPDSTFFISYGKKSVKYSRGMEPKDVAAKLDKISYTIEYLADSVIKNQLAPKS
jgi:hypothetical protein